MYVTILFQNQLTLTESPGAPGAPSSPCRGHERAILIIEQEGVKRCLQRHTTHEEITQTVLLAVKNRA